jgi:hypothetical protein
VGRQHLYSPSSDDENPAPLGWYRVILAGDVVLIHRMFPLLQLTCPPVDLVHSPPFSVELGNTQCT